MKPTVLLLSCEHAGNEVPGEYRDLFTSQHSVLASSRALDFGAGDIADHLSQLFDCDYIKSTITRLLIDCNRSLAHDACFSEFTKTLSKKEKDVLINNYYLPFRLLTENRIARHIAHGEQVLHLSIHTFVPETNHHVHNAAIALLYDPKRHGEKEVARIWHGLMSHHSPNFRIRLNYPYSGKNDSFTHALRKQYSEKDYLGIELECNQALFDNDLYKELIPLLSDSLVQLQKLL